MAEQAKSKIDEATEKASAEAAAKPQPAPKAAPKAEKPAVKKAAKKTAAKKPVAKKAKLKTATSKKAVAKKTAKKVAAKKAASKKKTAAPKAAPKTKTPTITDLKDKIMAKTTNDFTKTVKEAAADVQARLKTAYDKGSEFVSEATDFNKANLEALVESGKILAGAAQEMGRDAVEDTKSVFETVTADAKKMAAVKSPTELFQLQGEIARRNFDAVVAYNSKNTEKMIKLANDAFAPISSRMSVAAEKISKAA